MRASLVMNVFFPDFQKLLLGVLLLCAIALQASPGAALPAAAEFSAAQETAASGKMEEAIQQYRQLVRAYPFSKNAAEAQFQIAQLLQKSGDFETSFREYTKLLNKYPDTSHFENAVAEQVIIANAYLKGRKVKVFGVPAYPSMEKQKEPKIKASTKPIAEKKIFLEPMVKLDFFPNSLLAMKCQEPPAHSG